MSAAAQGRTADVFMETAGAERLRPRLREGYLYLRRPGLEVRAGQQIIPWGQADAVNPTDFLTAKDYTFFNIENAGHWVHHDQLAIFLKLVREFLGVA